MPSRACFEVAGDYLSRDLGLIERLLSEHPDWGRSRLSVALCEQWSWRAANGQLKDMACLLFGAAAWTCRARDAWIGWDASARERNLPLVANNTRFLVLPWVGVPHMASHLLSRIARRIQADRFAKYGHSLHCLETLLDTTRDAT